jgi:selenocysteine lyase/cysteine desulfurase
MHCIEDFIRDSVLTLYGNTHTTSSATGLHSTLTRKEARAILMEAVGGGSDDAALFVGSGSTGAIAKLVNMLTTSSEWRSCIAARKPPLVLTGPYEHHSNILPWRESGARVIAVRESIHGGVDMNHLEELLLANAKCRLKIGTFSAASNITGIISDTVAISVMLHRHGALAFFDYAAAGPYLPIDMNPSLPGADAALAHKDAVFLSPHKLVGGVATPGVLAVKRAVARRFGGGRAPTQPGGGTVLYVLEQGHEYLEALEEREEGGTPDIVGAVRCALAFRLKAAVGPPRIVALESDHWARLRGLLAAHPAVHVLGNLTCPRLAIVSFLVRHGGRYLHHSFVAALLNDLFGIQARAGCACAGPYGYRLLGVDRAFGEAMRLALRQGDALAKPGFVRLGAAYFLPGAAVDFLAAAVGFVAEHGWRLLPLYAARPGSDEWRHRAAAADAPGAGRALAALSFGAPSLADPAPSLQPPPSTAPEPGALSKVTVPEALSPGGPSTKDIAELGEKSGLGRSKGGSAGAGSGSDARGRREAEEAATRAGYLSAALAAAEAAGEAAAADPGLAARLAEEETAGEGWLLRSEGRRLRWFALPSEAAARQRACGAGARAPALDPASGFGPFVEGRGREDEDEGFEIRKAGMRPAGCFGGARVWLGGRR